MIAMTESNEIHVLSLSRTKGTFRQTYVLFHHIYYILSYKPKEA